MNKLIDATKTYLPITAVVGALTVVFLAGGIYSRLCLRMDTLEVQAKETKEILKNTPTRLEWIDFKNQVEKYQAENKQNFEKIMEYLKK